MVRSIANPLRRIFRWIKDLIKSNKTVRALLYDIENVSGFTNLYEHEKMLSDVVRVDTYHAAIQRHVKPGDVVVDLGTGTGILSIFAAKRNPKTVYAIDHSEVISMARTIAKKNNAGNIQFIQLNSRSFTPNEQVDVILHEQIGDDLFDENMIENILDLKQRVLKKSGKVLPGKFELFLEPVSLRTGYKVAHIWENNIHGVDYTFLKNSDAIRKYKTSDYHLRFIPPSAFGHFLCEPLPILTFDLNEMNDISEIPQTIDVSRTITRAGTMDGMCLYLRAIFDSDISFDTSPTSTATHWGNRLFRLECRHYEKGENISYCLTMKDLIDPGTWSVDIRNWS